MVLESTSVIISIISALVGVGFTIGFNVGKYQTKEKCELYRNDTNIQIEKKIQKINDDLGQSIVRIHERLDELMKGGCNAVQKEICN